jgi:hypothetical protein
MSFKSRDKRRRYKRTQVRAAVRRNYTDETAMRWYLTPAKRDGKCSKCGDKLKRGADVVYRHKPCEVRCVRCGGREPDSKGFRPSMRWERAKRAAVRA